MIGDTGEIKEADVKKAIEFIKLNQESLQGVWVQDLDPLDKDMWQPIT